MRLAEALVTTRRRASWGEAPCPIATYVWRLLTANEQLDEAEAFLQTYGVISGIAGMGVSSVVYLLGDDLVARVGVGWLRDLPRSQLVNQRIDGRVFEPSVVRIEIYPRLETRGITGADVAWMEEALAREGLRFTDPGPDNLGRDRDGALKVIDPDAVRVMGG